MTRMVAKPWWLPHTLALALLLAGATAPARAPAQTQGPASACAAGEPAEACYRRALEAVRPALRGQGGQGGAKSAAVQDAVAQLRGLCATGFGDACYFAGRLLVTLATDTAAARAADEAAALYLRGCNATPASGAACTGAGDRYAGRTALDTETDSALAFYRRGCTLRNPTACARQAARLRLHAELGPDRHRWAEQASNDACTSGGSLGGCVQALGHLHERLDRVPAAQRRSTGFQAQRDDLLSRYRNLCQFGSLTACARLARIYLEGELGATTNPEYARTYGEEACRGTAPDSARGPSGWLGDGSGCATLGALALRAEQPDSGDAVRYFGVACRLGATDACVDQALASPGTGRYALTFSGRLFLFLNACAQESGRGCERAGWEYEHDAVAPDTARAALFYRRACESAYAAGCTQMARLAWETRQDTAATVKYYRHGCALGEGAACVRLADLARSDDGERATRLLRRVCEQGSAVACWRLMNLYVEALDEENAGIYRAATCRLDRTYCKRAEGEDDLEAQP
ncbi:MAG TPA: hypothetical protein VFS20_08425 [Longimicrobium sp.]|nr:hypothetical protein [Longimicrobium sp.]